MYLLSSEAGQAGDKWSNPNMSEEQRDPALQSWHLKETFTREIDRKQMDPGVLKRMVSMCPWTPDF